MSDFIQTREDGVLTLTFNRPDRRNALSPEMRIGLREALEQTRIKGDCRCVLLTGSGGSFCAGADLDLDTILSRRATIEGEMQRGINQIVTLMRDLAVPIVAAVDGPAAGAGFGLALAADFLIVSDRARFHLSFPKIGASPDAGVVPALVNRIGAARATAAAMLGQPMTSDQALVLGLAYARVPADDLVKEARALARTLSEGPTRSYAMTKRLVNAAVAGQPVEQALALEAACQQQAFATQDFEEGVRAFADKRAPVFTGT